MPSPSGSGEDSTLSHHTVLSHCNTADSADSPVLQSSPDILLYTLKEGCQEMTETAAGWRCRGKSEGMLREKSPGGMCEESTLQQF